MKWGRQRRGHSRQRPGQAKAKSSTAVTCLGNSTQPSVPTAQCGGVRWGKGEAPGRVWVMKACVSFKEGTDRRRVEAQPTEQGDGWDTDGAKPSWIVVLLIWGCALSPLTCCDISTSPGTLAATQRSQALPWSPWTSSAFRPARACRTSSWRGTGKEQGKDRSRAWKNWQDGARLHSHSEIHWRPVPD